MMRRERNLPGRTERRAKALRTGNFRELCREYGISAKTGYKWRERFLRQGLGGMAEQSRRPQGQLSNRAKATKNPYSGLLRIREQVPGAGRPGTHRISREHAIPPEMTGGTRGGATFSLNSCNSSNSSNFSE